MRKIKKRSKLFISQNTARAVLIPPLSDNFECLVNESDELIRTAGDF